MNRSAGLRGTAAVRPARPGDEGLSPRLEAQAIRWALVSAVGGAAAAFAIAHGSRLPLGGEASVGSLAGLLAAVAAAAAFSFAFVTERRRGHLAWRRALPWPKRATDLLALCAAMMMLSALLVIAVAELFQLGFRGLTIDPFGTGALTGAACGAVAYGGSVFGARLTSSGVAMLATLVLFLGTLASMVSSPDAEWWQFHFSRLGNEAGYAGYQFNLALITTGAVVTALANLVAHDLETGLRAHVANAPARARLFAWLLAGIGICLMIAGLVPDAVAFPVHVGAASGMVVLFAVLVGCLAALVPGMRHEVAVFSTVAIAGILVAVALWVPIGYYNLTGAEFVIAGLLFAWLLVFVRGTRAYADESVTS
ncbi:DUF998 domain-containing protein [Microbacterium dextranolyticum]|uniref:DUF998 domain-containing protein n=1 Tax=Microbacterium dextranolyticum TaxID=36806 RepID=A0A9W6HPF2_9MICO|nr:DUF998 domain-containing protein [Microbacterium dextranolyticum]MBM7464090.1 putative membrane protein [Microbacterium dextranolyticum]GLJ96582.1 hypothetical protein GCM10017591_26450 [Microbacterium dextranolyticum]